MLTLSMDSAVAPNFAREVLNTLDSLESADLDLYHFDVFCCVMNEIAPLIPTTIFN